MSSNPSHLGSCARHLTFRYSVVSSPNYKLICIKMSAKWVCKCSLLTVNDFGLPFLLLLCPYMPYSMLWVTFHHPMMAITGRLESVIGACHRVWCLVKMSTQLLGDYQPGRTSHPCLPLIRGEKDGWPLSYK